MNDDYPYQLEEAILFSRYGIVGYRTDTPDTGSTSVPGVDDSDVLSCILIQNVFKEN